MAIVKLYNSPAAEVARYDLAEMNLISAYGLPGTEAMDMGSLLARLDAWAAQVADYTTRYAGVYQRRPDYFGSRARYQITAMVHCLTREIGVRYNPDRITDPDNFDDPEDSFLHGLLGPRRLGTCSSLPVLLTSLGRRLGYPLRLVLAPRHVFSRWDAPDDRFNIEYHQDGLNSHPDDHYREWPVRWTEGMHAQERARPTLLLSLSPQQELAYCANTRAYHLDQVGRYQEGLDAAHVAYTLWPQHGFGVWVTHLATKATYPHRDWPLLPCEETAGQEAIDRLVRAKVLEPVD
ncbi:MAG: transglutaminase-like domain-containing protein [Gemmataceae bacterium]|nr:transglutaminase-like domain-containing protein [Gemmataceae bacterium]